MGPKSINKFTPVKALIFMLAILICGGFNINTALAASTNNFYFKDAEFDYYLEKTESGSKLHVKEVLTAVFPETNQNHGISRVIPTTNQDGKNVVAESESALNLKVQRNGSTERISKVEKGNGYYTFYIGSSAEYVHGTQTYTLEYDFYNVVTEFTSGGELTYTGENAAKQELYWDTNGTGWSQRFENLTARVHLPAEVAGNLSSGTSCYVGAYGATNGGAGNISSRCTLSMDDETTYNSSALNATADKSAETVMTFTASKLAAGENLSFAIDFTPGTFIVPRPAQNYLFLIITVGVCVLCGVILVLSALKYHKIMKEKKEIKKSLFVKPEYQPIKGLTVAEAAEVSAFSTKSSFVATLLELAVGRKVEIVKDVKQGVLKEKVSWKVKVKDASELTGWQDAVLKILAGGAAPESGKEITVESHRATSSLEALKKSYGLLVETSLKKKELFEEKPQKVSVWYIVLMIGIIWAVACFGIGIALSTPNMAGGVPVVAVAIAVPVITLIVLGVLSSKSQKLGQLTRAGLEASAYMEGLKLYINMAEKERLKFLQSVKGADTSAEGIVKLYEKLLPYACIFGAEESWMNELNKYYKEHPEIEHGWYYGDDIMSYAIFHSMMNTTSSTIVSSTSYSSSSSSGGGGGGFSGGGGGGGGGGGW